MSSLTFNRKPIPLLPEHRPIYKITQLLLVLNLASRGKKSSLIRLHLFSWVLKDEKRKKVLLESAKGDQVLFGVWGLDPTVNISLQYSLAEGLVSVEGSSYKLSSKGLDYISQVDENLYEQSEFLYLQELKARITEKMVMSIVSEWE